jgi:hypothetical protein
MGGTSPRKRKIAVVPHTDGTLSIAIALQRYRFQRSKGQLKWSLALLDEELDFLYEPAPGVQIRPRLVLRIEGRVPKNMRSKAWSKLELHKIRSKQKALW